jgi:putative transposase
MLLSKKTSIKVSQEYANVIGHMCYAASKLWNVCNYERQHYKEMGMEKYPDWYYQKKSHREDLWYKQLPSQTAQEVCKLLDKAWKSFYALKRSGGIENPRPPRFKQESIPITYMQMGIVHEWDTEKVRLSLPKALKRYMEETYQIHENFLYLENKIFRGMDQIKQLRIYPPEKGECKVIVVYEISEREELSQNGHYLSVDLGLHNLMTCYDSGNGNTFILGRRYLALERYFHKEIARVQAQWYGQQSVKGIKHPVTSKHIRRLIARKIRSVTSTISAFERKILLFTVPFSMFSPSCSYLV